MSWLESTFGVAKPILAMLHLAALPGDPSYPRDGSMRLVVERARHDLHALQGGGVDGIIFSNEFSLPYQRNISHVTVAAMGRIIGELLGRLAPEDHAYAHARILRSYGSTAGNPTGHLKAMLTGNHCLFPIVGGQLVMGQAQDVYFYEFDGPAKRTITFTVTGE